MRSRNRTYRVAAVRHTALVGGHQIGDPKPIDQRDLGPVKNRSGCQRDLMTAAGTLPPSLLHQFVRSPMSASRADEAIGPATGPEVLLASPFRRELRLEFAQGLRKRRARHASTLRLVVC